MPGNVIVARPVAIAALLDNTMACSFATSAVPSEENTTLRGTPPTKIVLTGVSEARLSTRTSPASGKSGTAPGQHHIRAETHSGAHSCVGRRRMSSSVRFHVDCILRDFAMDPSLAHPASLPDLQSKGRILRDLFTPDPSRGAFRKTANGISIPTTNFPP